MVTFNIPESAFSTGFMNLVGPIFQKLGLNPYIVYLHTNYIYTFLILAVLAAVGFAVLKLRGKKKTAARIGELTQIQEAEDIPVSQPVILAAACQHIGTREDQQDSYGVSEPGDYAEKGIVAVVADGMGGLANGRAVSSALVRSLLDGFANASAQQDTADFLLEQAVRANMGVNQMLRGQDRSGSTLVSCVIRGGRLHFLTVGDSRIYLYRGGALIQLNREHIYQEELAVKAVNQGASLQQVRGDRQAHALTSYFGIGRIPAIDRNDEGLKLLNGDKILLASDGIFGTLTQEQMEAALSQNVTAAANTLGQLVREANRPHQDNNTAVVLEYRI